MPSRSAPCFCTYTSTPQAARPFLTDPLTVFTNMPSNTTTSSGDRSFGARNVFLRVPVTIIDQTIFIDEAGRFVRSEQTISQGTAIVSLGSRSERIPCRGCPNCLARTPSRASPAAHPRITDITDEPAENEMGSATAGTQSPEDTPATAGRAEDSSWWRSRCTFL